MSDLKIENLAAETVLDASLFKTIHGGTRVSYFQNVGVLVASENGQRLVLNPLSQEPELGVLQNQPFTPHSTR